MNQTRLSRVLSCLLGLLVTSTIILVGAPASAAKVNKIHCSGFANCASKGYTNHGYSKDYKRSFWGALAGNNCTNYVAWRLSHLGRVVDRPSVLGNASDWGINAAAEGIPVLDSPKVGDVAWYSYRRGNATRSHVAIVEKVKSNGTVLLSEDNYGGTFDWRTTSASKPSGYIRFPQSNGSPHGFTKDVTVSGRKVTVTAYSEEADAPDRAATTVVSWGGPRGANADMETVLTKKMSGSWSVYRTFPEGKVPAPSEVYVYALNTPGTPGADTLIGDGPTKGSVVPPTATGPATSYATKSSFSFKKSKVRKTQRAVLKVRVSRTSAQKQIPAGKVVVYDRKKVIKTVTMASGKRGRINVTLPKLKKGTHKIRFRFVGATAAKSSWSSTRTLRVTK